MTHTNRWIFLPAAIVLGSAACSSDDTPATTIYQITVQVTGQGSVDPASAEVEAGASHSIRLLPAEDYEAANAEATGCDGELTGEHFVINEVTADCSIDISFALPPLALAEPEKFHSFYDDTMIPPHEYGGEEHEGGLVSYHGTASVQELWLDGYTDVAFSLTRGYASGIDTRVAPFLFRNENGRLVYDESDPNISNFEPTTSARRWATFGQGINDNGSGLFYVGHDGGDGTFGEAMLIGAGAVPEDITNSLPVTPLSNLTDKANSVHAHSMAGGDINDNGRTDFVVPDWGACNRDVEPWDCYDTPYYLIQNKDSLAWELVESDFLRDITLQQPLADPDVGEGWNLLLDVHLVDVNSNGLADLVAGYGHGSSRSYVYFNQGADEQGVPQYSREYSAPLPEGPYGYNGLHLFTWSTDFNNNGHQDLLILWSRFEPYYSGWSFQLLQNDGAGSFTDVSDDAFTYLTDAHQLGEYLEWTDNFTVTDLNGNGYPDIIGTDGGHPGVPPSVRMWLNDGSGGLVELPVDTAHIDMSLNPIAPWFDMAHDGVFGTAMMMQTATDDTFSELEVRFYQLQLNRKVHSLEAEQAAEKPANAN